MILTSSCLLQCQIGQIASRGSEPLKSMAAGLKDEQIEASLKLLARAVDDYAADVLHGDFSVFATLDKLVTMYHYT